MMIIIILIIYHYYNLYYYINNSINKQYFLWKKIKFKKKMIREYFVRCAIGLK